MCWRILALTREILSTDVGCEKMKSKKNIVGQALVNQGQKMVVKARIRTVLSLVLLCCGGVLLYLGLSGQQHLFTTFGIIFVLYALFMRFHVRRSKAVMTELEREVQGLTDTGETKQEETTQP
jgi:hypothetical protein